jgi:BlaI family penicillinase repressor
MTPDIADSEWAVMEVLWESSPQTAAEVTKALRPSTNWADNTVRTLLTRLVEKGALKTAESAAGPRTFSPAVSREKCVKAEGDSFLARIFGGAAKPLLVHFAQNSKLTAAEVKELKRLLDQSVNKLS